MLAKKYPDKVSYLLQIADNALIIGQRLGEWCGHGPILEQDIALTNHALDQIGQARMLYQYAAELLNDGSDEDSLAYLRDSWDFKNILLLEQQNGDFAHTIVRQFLFDGFNLLLMDALQESKDTRLAEIATKSLKEVKYHYRYSSEWVIRLGDGTEESNKRMQKALEDLWMYKDEAFIPSEIDMLMNSQGIGPDLEKLGPLFYDRVSDILQTARLKSPGTETKQTGGKTGVHTENLGFILADLQFLQRAYPNCIW
jgi:ring-1,2-phenylacetyl-CoA epoxidase subunit PaaC